MIDLSEACSTVAWIFSDIFCVSIYASACNQKQAKGGWHLSTAAKLYVAAGSTGSGGGSILDSSREVPSTL